MHSILCLDNMVGFKYGAVFFLQKLGSGSGFLTDDERDRENRERKKRER